MNNGDILLQVHSLINADRQNSYGPPSESFNRTAALWSAYMGMEITAKDVCVCMALLKLAREAHRHKPDNLLDACGYIALASDMEGDK
ncbi:MAG: DUF6378 domain-containing protein [Desulfovibrio sp.]|jgi:hypothetical protein|nr:DUF6378 domain-containing protein [Desulfovibrio sp.]